MIKQKIQQQIRHVGRTLYWRLPSRWRDAVVELAFRRAGRLFRGYPAYELWRQRGLQRAARNRGLAGDLVDLGGVAPLAAAPGRIAVHLHLFYVELAGEFATHFRELPFAYDLFVSVTDEHAANVAQQTFGDLPRLGQLQVAVVPNRGRDLAPLFCVFGDMLKGYDLLAHVHSKKSLYNQGATDGWRSYLLGSLFGGKDRLGRIFRLLDTRQAGMVFPQCYSRVPYFAGTWLANRALGVAMCHRLGIERIPASGYFDFPVGSMFWARADALRPLFDAGMCVEDFPVEQGQTDGTLAHALERLLGVVALDSGMPLAILRDSDRPSWSHWRFEQYLQRNRQVSAAVLADPALKLLVFDIFDTLLLRPLIEPERIKQIVARRAGGALGEAYLAWRAKAEAAARHRAGRDVGLDAIYAELARNARLGDADVARLRELEIAVERAAVRLRPGAAALLQEALATGRPVVLASDMYLPRGVIEDMLGQHGLGGWSAFYLSSEIGLRKDRGDLYRHLLRTHEVAPGAVLMVGDNERSDLQIPADMGMRTLHLLRPLELARSMHRLRPLIERTEHDTRLEPHLGLGLLVETAFGPLFPEHFEADSLVPQPTARALAYVALGPLLMAFVQWLIAQARRDGIRQLYFLAREGEFLKQVYDRVAATLDDAPTSHYLVVSRRAVNVPAIRDLDDLVAIAQTEYGPASLEDFLRERFGVELDAGLARDLDARGIWKRGRALEIRQRDVAHLLPLLQALLPAILEQGRREWDALEVYLAGLGLSAGSDAAAVVDVGYSATIQRGLNALLGGGLHGYYIATFDETMAMESEWAVHAKGCYFHQEPKRADSPLFLVKSFILEKLLSADSAQVVCYRRDDAGRPRPVYRPLSESELDSRAVRAEVRAGAMQLVEDVLRLRAELLPDFEFPLDLALALWETLIDAPSPTEAALLRRLVLDDHYCGRGVVA